MLLTENRIRNIKIIFIYVLGFFLFFMPDLEPFIPHYKNIYILAVIDFFFIILYKKKLIYQFSENYIINGYVLFFLASIYTFFNTILHHFSIMNNMDSITVPLKLICLIGIVYLLNSTYKENIKKFDFIIVLGTIQGIVCILMVFFKPLKEIANTLYIYNIPNYFESNLLGITGIRIYGIAGDYTFSTPIFMALIASVSLYSFFKLKQTKYVLFSSINIIGSVLNGRTGLILFLIVFIILMFFSIRIKYLKEKKIYFVFSFLFILTTIYILKDSSWLKWLWDGLHEILLLFTGEKVGTFAVLDKFIFFPKGLDFFFGLGTKVYGNFGLSTIGNASDIGYINDIFRGGIIYISLFYGTMVYMLFKTYKKLNHFICKKDNLLFIFIISMFLIISNIKGEALSASSIMLGCLFFISVICSKNITTNDKGEVNNG
ncbi:hypothetical protein [[Eubacterium] hominis]|uniref:hypothetical protein n=1 Tax=[Eubacterium] hominis TaxID=2764325 RepID=UPI0022E1CAA7